MKTIGDFQIWIHAQRRAAKTEDEALGWIAMDAWLHGHMVALRKRHLQHSVESFPLYRLIEDKNDE